MTPGSTLTTRQEREREFHNAAFTDRRRTRLAPVYAIMNGSTRLYWSLVRQYADGGRLLEYGCGASALASTDGIGAAEVVGIDISDVAVRQAAERAAAQGVKGSFHVMDAEALQFPERSFDVICSAAILHHLDLRRAFSEIARTLRPDGHAVFLEPLGHNPLINLYRRLTPSLRTPDEHPLLMSDIAMAGEYFGRAEAHYFALTTFAAIPLRGSRSFTRLLHALERFDGFLFRWLPWLRRHAWQVVLVLSEPKATGAPPLVRG